MLVIKRVQGLYSCITVQNASDMILAAGRGRYKGLCNPPSRLLFHANMR